MTENDVAPGYPGIEPRWTSSAKEGVGTSIDARSRVWFTISHGILNEIYYPRIDLANMRDFGFLVSDGQDFFSEEKRDTNHKIRPLSQGVPGYHLRNTCVQGRYRISKTIIADPAIDALIQEIQFEPLMGGLCDYSLYALMSPHIENAGWGNDGWVGEYKGRQILFAKKGDVTMALACSTPFKALSCGYVGFSDGWQDVRTHKKMEWRYPKALDGNIALTAEIDLKNTPKKFLLALGFGRNPDEAALRAVESLCGDFKEKVDEYILGWKNFQKECLDLGSESDSGFDLYRVSTAVLKTHVSKRFAGGMIASLSIPWGFSKGDEDIGGYHLVWPRDMVQSAMGLLAAGNIQSAKASLLYLAATQEADGHWPQNMWLDGSSYWPGIQMDETALPIILADFLKREGKVSCAAAWPMVKKAAAYICRYGPVTAQDRWEEDSGYSTYTLAVEIAALLSAADFADENNEKKIAQHFRETADLWNFEIERWTYVSGTDLARQAGVSGYYVRITPQQEDHVSFPNQEMVALRNRSASESSILAENLISPDALALVRFGIRAADDPRILNTVKVIDLLLKTETHTGPSWRRYNGDGYGEHEGGKPFNGTGVGRPWPLLTAERALYELALGRKDRVLELLKTIAAQTSAGGLIPEQIWDGKDIPERELFNGHPTGSAMPLVWAHAEYIKIVRSLKEGRVFDMPPQTVERYQKNKMEPWGRMWRDNHKIRRLPAGRKLRIGLFSPAIVRYSMDGWKTQSEVSAKDCVLNVYCADLPTNNLKPGAKISFSFFWTQTNKPSDQKFDIDIVTEDSFSKPWHH
jgi:glucoamylase